MMSNDSRSDWARSRITIFFRLVCAMSIVIAAAATVARADAQKVFNTPDAAVTALINAAKTDDRSAALEILGPGAQKIIDSGDAVADKNARENFIHNYQQMHRLAFDSEGHVLLYLGAENWPFPIPLIKKGDGWLFDTVSGEREILYRRIGNNELSTIATLHELVTAQNEYKDQADGGGTPQFAQRVLSNPGTHDGLYWPATTGQQPSPIGPLVASATAAGYHAEKGKGPKAFHGYIYRLLTSQGKDAPGGAKDYLVDGKLTKGFAFVAYPAEYRSSGIMTFVVNQDGAIFQKDLKSQTATIAARMKAYDPDKSWSEVKEYSD